MINIKFEHDADRASAFDGKVKIGECVFVEEGNNWNIVTTRVNSNYQGQGIARRLVEVVLKHAAKNQKKVVATCSFAKKVIEK